MKTLLFFKKIALVGFFFLATSQLFAQSVYTQNVSDSGACDGSAYLDSTIIATATDILWIEANTGIQTGGNWISNLCEGTYTVTYTDGQGNTVSWFGRKLRNLPTTGRKMKDSSQLISDTKTN
jgi:hypothetical protein